MLETKVTNIPNGVQIYMDNVPEKYFIMSIAMYIISQCKEMRFGVDGDFNDKMSGLPHYDDLITEYTSGNHGSVVGNMLVQNVKILYHLVEDAVLTENVMPLYLLEDKPRCSGQPLYKLILLALDEYQEILEFNYSFTGTNTPKDLQKWNKYNKKFEELMIRDFGQ